MRRVLTILLAVTLLAAACGDDDGDGDEGAGSADPTTTVAADDDGAGGESTDTTTTAAPSDGDEAIELTDSHRGVTAESIAIGVAGIDVAELNRTFDLGLAELPVEAMYEAWAADLNADGGVNGRDVVINYGEFLPFVNDTVDALCTALMEDEETFVVIGQFLGDEMLCITQAYGHPYVGHFGETPPRQEASNGLFFGMEIAQTSQRVGGVKAMIEAGDFDGHTVGVVWQNADDRVYADYVLPVLDEAGVDVAEEIEVGEVTTDTVSGEQAWDLTIERMGASGVDFILNLSNISPVLAAVERSGDEYIVAHTNGQAADGTSLLEDTAASDAVRSNSFAVTTFKPNREESLADPGVQDCIAVFEAANPDVEVDTDSDDWVNGFTNHCRAFAMTVMILEAAGGDITPETFRAAGEGLGDIELPAMESATLGPDKHSAGSLLVRYEYDVEAEQYVRAGDPFVAES